MGIYIVYIYNSSNYGLWYMKFPIEQKNWLPEIVGFPWV